MEMSRKIDITSASQHYLKRQHYLKCNVPLLSFFLAENFVLMWNRINPRSGQKSMVAMDKMLMGNDPRISASIFTHYDMIGHNTLSQFSQLCMLD